MGASLHTAGLGEGTRLLFSPSSLAGSLRLLPLSRRMEDWYWVVGEALTCPSPLVAVLGPSK